MKIIKWEYFFVFDDGERELMWEIERKGHNLLSHEVDMLNDYQFDKIRKKPYPFVMVVTYANGTQGEI